MVGSDKNVSPVEAVTNALNEAKDFRNCILAGFHYLIFAGCFIANSVNYIVIDVD